MSRELPDGWSIRPACESDYDRGHVDLLSQLTAAGQHDASTYGAAVREIQAQGSHLMVVENHEGRIVGSATLLVEKKLIHSGAYVGHIEDVVVDGSCRGKGIGDIITRTLVNIAQSRGCYKVILDCNESNVGFYEKCGFFRKEIQMRRDV